MSSSWMAVSTRTICVSRFSPDRKRSLPPSCKGEGGEEIALMSRRCSSSLSLIFSLEKGKKKKPAAGTATPGGVKSSKCALPLTTSVRYVKEIIHGRRCEALDWTCRDRARKTCNQHARRLQRAQQQGGQSLFLPGLFSFKLLLVGWL